MVEKVDLKSKLWNVVKWKYMKKRLGYNNKEMQVFQENPKNDVLLNKAPQLMNKIIIAKVVESRGCNSQHDIGDNFYFDGFGNLLTNKSPNKICIYALNAIVPQIFAVTELLIANADPNHMRFNRASCFDVGVQCGGFGRIVIDISVVDKDQKKGTL